MTAETKASRPKKGVWITAYGTRSVLGQDLSALRAGLIEGRSGLKETPTLPSSLGALHFSACVGIVEDPLEQAPQVAAFPDTRQLRMGWSVLRQIEAPLRRTIAHFGADRVGLVLGTSTGGILSTEEALLYYRKHQRLPNGYSCLDGHAMDALARYIATQFDLRGPAYATSSACASGAKALASAKRLIERGIVDAVVAGGIDSLARMTIHGFHSLGVLSETNCRPFDDTSYGMNVSEGGAWLLLQRSDASSPEQPLAHLIGVGESSDAHHLSAPDPSGASQGRAMQRALDDAELEPSDIAYVNAHGTGTKANDTAEASAIRELFPLCPASSTKGFLGHQLGAAGATEAVIAAETARDLPLNPGGAVEPGHFPINAHPQQSSVLSNSFAFGGANISLVVHRGQSHTPAPASSSGLSAIVTRACALCLSESFGAISTETEAQGELLDPKKIGSLLLGSRGRARASELTRLFAESLVHLKLEKEELSQIPLFIGSALGQIQTSKSLIELFLDGDASPLAFQGSVHNATAGVLSIALKNQQPSSSIAAGPDTFFSTVLEAQSYLDPQNCPRVLVLVGDERAPRELGLPLFDSAVSAFLLEHPEVVSTQTGVRLRILPKSELPPSPTRNSIVTPEALQAHISGEGLGLAEWIVARKGEKSALVSRPVPQSPWTLLAERM